MTKSTPIKSREVAREKSLLMLACAAFVLFSPAVSAQELSCDTSVAPSTFHKAIQKSNSNKSAARKVKFSASTAEPNSPVYPARVLASKGDAFLVERNGQRVTPVTLSENFQVQLNDVIETGVKSFVSIQYGDSSINVLPTNSKVKLGQRSPNVVRVELLRGEVESRVTKKPNAKANTFEIQLPTVSIGVRGTHFRVKLEELGGRVEVEDGIVRITRANMCVPASILKAGEAEQIFNASSNTVQVHLLEKPELLASEEAQRDIKDVKFTVKPVAGAVRYRLQIAEDSRFVNLQSELVSESPTFILKNDTIRDGFHYLRVSGIDGQGFEGKTSEHLFLRNRQPL